MQEVYCPKKEDVMSKRFRRTLTLPVLALGLLSAVPAAAQLPHKAVPPGMLQEPTGGTGCILTAHMGGTRSAHKMLLALKIVSGEYFDGPLKVTRAFADRHDRNLQAAFVAKLRGLPVRGVVLVTTDDEGGQGTLLFDQAKTFSQSFRKLAARPGTKAGSIKLTRQNAPDGSGQISLPPGFWIADSYKGTMDIDGPHGAYMGLGGHVVCTRPEAAEMFPGIPTVDFNDPVQAMLDYLQFMGRKAGVRAEAKILSVQTVHDWPNGRAAFVRYSTRAGGKTTEGFGLFAVMPTDENQALFYQSFLNASPETYRTQFPAMLKAWGTYSINSAVFQERLTAAANSMRGMSDIMQSVNDNRQVTSARGNAAWDDYIRDETTWGKGETGRRYKVDNAQTNDGSIPTENGVPLQPIPLSEL